MKKLILQILKDIPLMLFSLFLAVMVWVYATVSSDPAEEGRFSGQVIIETTGLEDDMLITSGLPYNVIINLRAPNSVWRKISLDRTQAKAIIDVTGLEDGTYELPINIEIDASPVQVISYSPNMATVTIEKYETREYSVEVDESGDIPTAFRAGTPEVTPGTVSISGTVSQLDTIDRVAVQLERNNDTESIDKSLTVFAFTEDGMAVRDLTIKPDKVKVFEEIKMRGGYRILSVKLAVDGEIAQGYRVDEISVDPGFVTVYSADKELLNSLNSYIETETILLDDINANVSKKIALMVPEGVTLVGDSSVTMNVTVSMVEGTTTFSEVPVRVIGQDDNIDAVISPQDVDVYLAGPMVTLNGIEKEDINVVVDLSDLEEGSYQITPNVEVIESDTVTVQSVMPATIEVQITPIEATEEELAETEAAAE